jgi:hypothetical protein
MLLGDLGLRPREVDALVRRTEGWPAGLYLAALSLRGRDDLHSAVAGFGGDDRLVADYLRDEVLDLLDPDQLAFLERTAVLDELSGPLCDAMRERTGSGSVLRDMSRSNLLVMPLDDARSWAFCSRSLRPSATRASWASPPTWAWLSATTSRPTSPPEPTAAATPARVPPRRRRVPRRGRARS